MFKCVLSELNNKKCCELLILIFVQLNFLMIRRVLGTIELLLDYLLKHLRNIKLFEFILLHVYKYINIVRGDLSK